MITSVCKHTLSLQAVPLKVKIGDLRTLKSFSEIESAFDLWKFYLPGFRFDVSDLSFFFFI